MAESSGSHCDLDRVFGDIVRLVPAGPEDEGFVFHAGVLPAPQSPSLSTDRILIRKAHHDYNGWFRAEALWMSLSERTCRELGLFLLACGFHGPEESVALELTHPGSEIRRIMIPAGKLSISDPPCGLSLVPFALHYFPAETARHPWRDDCCQHDLPLLALSNAEDCVGPSEENWRGRDTVWIWAGQRGTFRLAELLLNAGCAGNPVRDYALEGDAGYRGVAPMSAELRIFLPGSDGWGFEDDPN